MVLGHAAAGRRFGGRGGRGGWRGASVGGGAPQFRWRGELGLAPSENRRIGRTKLTKYPYSLVSRARALRRCVLNVANAVAVMAALDPAAGGGPTGRAAEEVISRNMEVAHLF